MARGLAAAAAGLALGGCVWAGPALYAERDAETPVPAGRYRADVDGDATVATVELRGRATWVAIDGEVPVRVLLIPLASGGRRLWIVQAPITPGQDPVSFGLIERAGDGWRMAPYIPCGGSEALVTAAGGTVEPAPAASDRTPACLFRDKPALERGVRAWLAGHRLEATLRPAD